jgi:spermidine synthase
MAVAGGSVVRDADEIRNRHNRPNRKKSFDSGSCIAAGPGRAQAVPRRAVPPVIAWSLVDTAQVPGAGELRLMRRGAEFSIKLGQTELMNSRRGGSEAALATLACERIRACARPRLLIGGLGMGFTLRAALAALASEARITVAELVPAVLTWARGPMAAVFGQSLADPRVRIREADVGELIRRDPAAVDAILLDVDNGPAGLTRAGNDGLYDLAGLHAAHAALRPGGVLAVWSAGPDADFARRLRQTGFAVEEIRARANRARGARHVIWIATRADRGRQASRHSRAGPRLAGRAER